MATRSSRQRRIGFDARHQLILDAARQVFAEVGYGGASMGDIARRAGITKPVLYDHFESKRALHVWLLERQRDELLRSGAEQMALEGTAEARVARTFDWFFRYVAEQPYALRMLFRETTGDPEVAAAHRRIHAEASEGIAGLLLHDAEAPGAVGSGEQDLAPVVGELLRGGLHSVTVWWQEHPDVPREDLVRLCMNVYWRGIENLRNGRTWEA